MKRISARLMAKLPLSIIAFALVLSLFQTPVFATDEPAAERRSAVVSEQVAEKKAILFDNLANASTLLDGQLAESAIWQYWFNQAPTAEARGFLDAAIERREAYDFEAAEAHLDKLIETEPDYAEGYNQRAFIRFLRENLAESKADLEKTLAMMPNHFAALAGLYQVQSRLGEQDEALANLAKAVSLHPWLKERGGLPKAMWPKSYREIHEPGQDI